MSVSRELRERFSRSPENNAAGVSPIVTEALGIANADLEEVIIGDISAMLKKGYYTPLEGYIFCLSRIISHKKAWKCILKAYSDCGQSVPKKYYPHFGQDPDEFLPKKGPTVI